MPAPIGFTIRHAPYGNNHVHEAMDAIMACAAYGYPVHVFFLDDGVFSLLPQQNTESLKMKSVSKQLQALPLYDVEQFWVCQQSIDERQINKADLPDEAVILSAAELKEALKQQKHLLSF